MEGFEPLNTSMQLLDFELPSLALPPLLAFVDGSIG